MPRSKKKSVKRKNSLRLYGKKWKKGMCVAPPGMPDYYVLDKKVGNTWKAVHVTGRYFDMIPESNEKLWVIKKCKK
jgi:hypothetical protein